MDMSTQISAGNIRSAVTLLALLVTAFTAETGQQIKSPLSARAEWTVEISYKTTNGCL